MNTTLEKKQTIMRASLVSILLLATVLIPVSQESTAATKCKPVKPNGQAVGRIVVGDVNMPIIPFTYPAGGVMEPQKSTEMLAMSLRHMPLSSTLGTTVLAWHVNFNGCNNDLNTLVYKDVGDRFSITDETGKTTTYRITRKTTVKKGDYKKSWFSLVGPRKLAMFTCSGAFVNGHYVNNDVIIAIPD